MEIVKESKVLILDIEYNLQTEGREGVHKYLNEKYGEFAWRSTRSGPYKGPNYKGDGRGLFVAEVNLEYGK